MKEPKLVVVGSSNTDMIVQSDRLPLPGETVLGGELVTAHGGKGANQAVAAARLGAQVTFISRIGEDANGEATFENLAQAGLDLEYLVRDPDTPSGVALIIVNMEGQNVIAVAPGANAKLTPADVEAASHAMTTAQVMLLQLETPLETVLAAARAARQAGATVILNPAPAPSEGIGEEMYASVDIITPNQIEASLLAGQSEPEAAASALLQRGVGKVIVTLGESGALLEAQGGRMVRIPGFEVHVVDTTAAGDAFNAGLAVGLARGESLEDAIRYANAVAALCVTRLGAQPSLPIGAEVETFLRMREK